MDKMLVVVFDNEAKALEGLQVLRDLDGNGEIFVYEAQVVAREPSGAVRVIDNKGIVAFSVIAGGGMLGALVGLLGGPVGALVGAGTGALIGWIADLEETGVSDEFIKEVETALRPGKVALLAEISEDWVTPLDTRMEEIGGVVFRRAYTLVKTTEDDRDAAAHRTEMERLKVERTQARSDRLAKIDAKIDGLRVKLENAIERKRAKMQLRQQQREAKIQALQAKANRAEGEARRRQEARIAELRREYEEKAAVS
jgi:uncharacterized membrane protein